MDLRPSDFARQLLAAVDASEGRRRRRGLGRTGTGTYTGWGDLPPTRARRRSANHSTAVFTGKLLFECCNSITASGAPPIYRSPAMPSRSGFFTPISQFQV